MGIIKVGKMKRRVRETEFGTLKATIDWPSSNKLKKEIIARGETPYEAIRDELGNKIGDNGGVEWLCYYTSDHYYMWLHSPMLALRNSFKYKFKVSWTNGKILSQAIDNSSEFKYKLIESKK